MVAVTDLVPRADYIGDGSTDTYPFDFPIKVAADLKVYQAGVLLTIATDYTVTINTDGSGEIELVAGNLTDGVLLALVRNGALTQPTVFTNTKTYPPTAVQNAIDRLTLQLQSLQEIARHALRIPLAEDADGVLPSASDRRSTLVGFDGDGLPLLYSAAVLSGGIFTVSETAVNLVMSAGYTFLMVDTSAGDVVITLPPSSQNLGLPVAIGKKTNDANLVLITTQDDDLIDYGEAPTDPLEIDVQNGVWTLMGIVDGWKLT